MTSRWRRLSAAARHLRKSDSALRKLIERQADGKTSASFYGIDCCQLLGRWHVDLHDWAERTWSTLAEAAAVVGRSEEALRRAVERYVEKTGLDPTKGFDLDGMFFRRFGPRCWLVDVGAWAAPTGPRAAAVP